MNAEDTKQQNNQTIEQLKKENRELKKLRDELLANKRVNNFRISPELRIWDRLSPRFYQSLEKLWTRLLSFNIEILEVETGFTEA
jgi:hypothetical protein